MLDVLTTIAFSIMNYLVITTIIDGILMGYYSLNYHFKCKVTRFLITKENTFSFQSGYACSAFASAYVMRHYGLEADGTEVYKKMPGKLKNGLVYPKGILALLSQYGFQVKYCRGNLNSLKNEISRGNPVIVLIRTYAGKNWLHFVPVVGYDETSIFIAESMEELVNCKEAHYNRRVDISEFKKLWNTWMLKMPLYKNTYITITHNPS